ncbi:hypothetical protein YC2023_084970 [Brassica napus]
MKENVEPDSDDQAKPLMKEIIVNTSLADWLASPKTFHGNGLCKRSQLVISPTWKTGQKLNPKYQLSENINTSTYDTDITIFQKHTMDPYPLYKLIFDIKTEPAFSSPQRDLTINIKRVDTSQKKKIYIYIYIYVHPTTNYHVE